MARGGGRAQAIIIGTYSTFHDLARVIHILPPPSSAYAVDRPKIRGNMIGGGVGQLAVAVAVVVLSSEYC